MARLSTQRRDFYFSIGNYSEMIKNYHVRILLQDNNKCFIKYHKELKQVMSLVEENIKNAVKIDELR